ncbi:jmjC domain-containing histone demethylation protein 1-like [Schistocerca cancellata]|uniref:jmjC domain-containing histone demethylation protein 1-like n=1 Tax=Schistocerca cancellata TaxID=274614 RepID=UPI002117E71B|nr:jmjC domain-containing histone demethylation protein 1-like [Schistocerca cancellata]
MIAAEQATVWADSATASSADRQPVPFTWCAMMPVVIALIVIRTGSALAERYLHVQLPDNRDLVSWLQRQRIELEQLQAAAAWNIRTHCVDESDPIHRLLNTWPLNIPYRAAQQLGIIPVRVHKQPSDTESTSMPPLEVVKSSSASDLPTLTEDEENTAPSSREVTPPPEAVGEKSMYFSPEGDRQTEENMEPEEPQDDEQEQEQEEAEGEKSQEQKAEELPTITAEEAERAARTVVQPQPSASVLSAEEAERAAMDVVPPLPPPQPAVPSVSSEQLLAAEGASRSEPGTSTRELKASSKALKSAFFRNLF